MSNRAKRVEEALQEAVALMRHLYSIKDWAGPRLSYALHPDSPDPQAVLDKAVAALAMVEDAPDEYRRGVLAAAGEVDRLRAIAEAQWDGEALAYLDDLITQLRLMGKGEP